MRLSDLPFLIESSGFVNRREGEIFYNPNEPSDKVEFIRYYAFPEDRPQFYDVAEREEKVQELYAQHVDNLYFVNSSKNSRMLAIYMIEFRNPETNINEYYYKFVSDTNDLAGKSFTSIPPGTKPGHGGYRLDSAASKSEMYAIKPSDVIKPLGIDDKEPTDIKREYKDTFKPENISGLIRDAAVEDFPEDLRDQMASYLDHAAMGQDQFVIKDGAKYRSAHEKYLGEWSAPIAVIKGEIDNPDILRESEISLLGGKGLEQYKHCEISYPTDVSQKLVDSYLISPSGKRIGISSKTKRSGGASASVLGLYEILQKKADDPNIQNVRDKYREQIEILELLVNNSQQKGPIALAQHVGIISDKEADMINEAISGSLFGDEGKLSVRLTNMKTDYNADTENPRYDENLHILTAVGHKACNKINLTDEFSDMIKDILTYDDFLQVYARTTKKGDDLLIEKFHITWPAKFQGQAKLDPYKALSASKIRGRIGFKFIK